MIVVAAVVAVMISLFRGIVMMVMLTPNIRTESRLAKLAIVISWIDLKVVIEGSKFGDSRID